jgi:hypothetical protein
MEKHQQDADFAQLFHHLGPRELLKMRALASATDRHGARCWSGVSRDGMKAN